MDEDGDVANEFLVEGPMGFVGASEDRGGGEEGGAGAGSAGAAGARSGGGLPRWREARDLQKVLYCLWCRRQYVKQSRLMAKRDKWRAALRDIGQLSATEMYEAVEILGQGAGLKEALGSPNVAEHVKRALRRLLLCMSSVVGSNAHRTTLRHVDNSYSVLFGPPLVFTTPNMADPMNIVMRLMYEGAELGSWRLLEEEAPEMPSIDEMCRRVARDPVSQAQFFEMMMRLFLEHVLGVLPGGCERVDGVSSAAGPDVMGCVQAFFGPVETQGRGGLHPHMHVWILHPMKALILDRLRRREGVEELAETLKEWRVRVCQKVASMQFESVQEIGRQLGLRQDGERLGPVPFSVVEQAKSYSAEEDGRLEVDDLLVKAAHPRYLTVRNQDKAWIRAEPQGPRRARPRVPVVESEVDPHQRGRSWKEARKAGQTGAVCTLQPCYRRLPPYRILGDGTCVVCVAEGAERDAKLWSRCFGLDARRCFVRSHLHRCMRTCFKHKRSGEEGDLVRVCRFGFNREYHVALYARPNPERHCGRANCFMAGCRVKGDGERAGKLVHPQFCPAPAAGAEVKKFLRAGKALVLPREAYEISEEEVALLGPEAARFLPRVVKDGRYGRLGRVAVLRYDPVTSSSNPAGQVLLRCNWDVQCFDRVFTVCLWRLAAAGAGEGAECQLRGGGGRADEEEDAFLAQAQEEYAALLGDDGAGAWEGPPEDEGLASAAPVSGQGDSGVRGEVWESLGPKTTSRSFFDSKKRSRKRRTRPRRLQRRLAVRSRRKETKRARWRRKAISTIWRGSKRRSEGRSRGPDLVRRRKGEQVWRAKCGKIP